MMHKSLILTIGLGIGLVCGTARATEFERIVTAPARLLPSPVIPPAWKGPRMFGFGANTSAIHHADEQNFQEQVLQSDVPVLVDFYADWCGPCQRLTPVLEEVARELPAARVVKVNIDQNPRLAAYFGVSSIPNLIVFKDGQVVGQHVGLANKGQLRALLAR